MKKCVNHPFFFSLSKKLKKKKTGKENVNFFFNYMNGEKHSRQHLNLRANIDLSSIHNYILNSQNFILFLGMKIGPVVYITYRRQFSVVDTHGPFFIHAFFDNVNRTVDQTVPFTVCEGI